MMIFYFAEAVSGAYDWLLPKGLMAVKGDDINVVIPVRKINITISIYFYSYLSKRACK